MGRLRFGGRGREGVSEGVEGKGRGKGNEGIMGRELNGGGKRGWVYESRSRVMSLTINEV